MAARAGRDPEVESGPRRQGRPTAARGEQAVTRRLGRRQIEPRSQARPGDASREALPPGEPRGQRIPKKSEPMGSARRSLGTRETLSWATCAATAIDDSKNNIILYGP